MEQEWLLIDMHTHSEASKKRKKGENVRDMSAKDFVDTLYNYGNKVFSVTDHNTFDAEFYDRMDQYIADKSLDIKLINGVEFDTYIDDKNFIQICIYFEDHIDRTKLEEIVGNLYGTDKKPKFDEILDSLASLDCKLIVIPHGDKQGKRGIFNKKNIQRLESLKRGKFYKYAMYKVFNAYEIRPGSINRSENIWATKFYSKTKMFNELTNDWSNEQIDEAIDNIFSKFCENKQIDENEQLIYEYIKDYSSYFAYFHFSDWHNNVSYEPECNNYIFGSLKYAFDSFELATLDPESRIILKVNSDKDFNNKKIIIPNNFLQQVSFKIGSKQKIVRFTSGLNAVVGKRGAGKSLLLSVIHELNDKDSKYGPKKAYSKLHISDIEATNRKGTLFGAGSLGSIAFLEQNQIQNIFDNPEQANSQISNKFPEIHELDMTPLNNVKAILEKIKPYNNNYKGVSVYITSKRSDKVYNYSKIAEIEDNEVESNFDKVELDLSALIDSISDIGLNSTEIKNFKNQIAKLKEKYLKMIHLYGNIVQYTNGNINNIKDKMNETNKNVTSAMLVKNEAFKIIENNFSIMLNFKKLEYELSNFKMVQEKVRCKREGDYLFVTYYAVPENINEIIIEKITDALKYAKNIADIKKYVEGTGRIDLKAKTSSLDAEYKKFLAGDIFKPLQSFYQINDSSIEIDKIETLEDLKKITDGGRLTDLSKASLGMKSAAYLNMLFDLEADIIVIDQPEDNIDNDYLSKQLVPNIKKIKKDKQLIFVTHNPTVAVYGDAFNYIYVTNEGEIEYNNYVIESKEDKEKLLNILEGGRYSFSNRNKKFGNVVGAEYYEDNSKKW